MSRTQKTIYQLIFWSCLVIQVLPVIRSGLNYNFGIGFWGPNGHDGIWHLSLINHIQNPLNINLPAMAGQTLNNYHPFFDILIAFLSFITQIPSHYWLFQIFPIISTFIFLRLSYLVGQKFTHTFAGGIYFVCFNTFANSFGWLITLARGQGIGGESLFWSMQSASNQINPPYILSLIFILWLLYLLPNLPTKLSTVTSIKIVFIFSLLPITKAYAIIPALIILGIYTLKCFFQKIYQPSYLFVISTICLLIVFRYYNPHSSGLLVISPFWFTKSLVESIDRLYLPLIAHQLYLPPTLSLFVLAKLTFAYSLCFGLFIVGNFGFRLIGFHQLSLKGSWLNQALLLAIVILILIPTIFVQNGTSWNTIQFVYYALFFSNLFLAKYLIKSSKLAIFILVVNLVSNYSNFQNSLGNPPPAKIDSQELVALKFLQTLPAGTVLTYPYDKYLKNQFSTPIPLYAYETTSYVSAYSLHPTFVDDYMNLANSGYNYQSRLESSLDFFQQKNVYADRGFLVNNQISYVYLAGLQKNKTQLDSTNLYLTKVFENPETIIYQVQK